MTPSLRIPTRRAIRIVLAVYVVLAIVAGGAMLNSAWSAPAWRRDVVLSGHRVSVPVAPALRFATSERGLGWLDGRAVDTAYGRVTFAREPITGRLVAECRPCTLAWPAFGPAPVRVEVATLTVARVEDHVAGELRVGGLAIGWHGHLSDDGLRVEFALPDTPLAAALAPLELPELAYALIDGTVAARGTVQFPGARLALEPTFVGLRVDGLGTGRLRRPVALAGCDARPRVGSGPAWRRLSAAVIAAEDQRYYEHPGYDLEELRAALAGNAAGTEPVRGASTIPQQLARMVYVGAERDLARKLRELLYAVEMERTLGKARMLDLYLAMAPWGSGGCGAQAASRALYGRELDRLSTAEIARLAAGLRDDERWRDVDAVVRIVRTMRTITRTERADAVESLCAGSVAGECVARELRAAR